MVIDCRHGRVLVQGMKGNEVIVCDPITTRQHRMPLPPEFSKSPISAAVLCAASEQGHVHGGCHSSPFKVVLVNMCTPKPIASVYSSETATWGNIISTESPGSLCITAYQGSLVGNALYWLQHEIGNGILAFDLHDQSLAVIRGPTITIDFNRDVGQIIQAENGALGLAVLSYPRLHMWQRNVNGHGVATWLMWKTIEIHTILGLPPQIPEYSKLSGYYEDTDAIFIYVDGNAYMVQLQSMECKRLDGTHNIINFYPFTSFYPPGTTITG
uniref:F-box protein AT5G49610-like beta-propeller domain-containing protein n=1 Tax=Triticum urartu TaxID=4572 RepID=A0A8R7TPX3_TRIUA